MHDKLGHPGILIRVSCMYSAGGRGINGGGVENALLCDEPSPAYLAASIFFSSAADIDVPALGESVLAVILVVNGYRSPRRPVRQNAERGSPSLRGQRPTTTKTGTKRRRRRRGTKGGGRKSQIVEETRIQRKAGRRRTTMSHKWRWEIAGSGTLLSLSSISRLSLCFSAAALS
ncbi:hypothetical protein BDZ89DRAFT_760247 [Hymenopellis radicata]|nr:hypothetical protein BDZ89DRAFT_760247 [Hymenopellis radicata]